MKQSISILSLVITLLFCFSVQAQNIPTPQMPTYVSLGAAFNQLGSPRVNAWASAIVPVSSQKGVYESTTADIIPVTKFDPVTKRNVYTFSAQIRQGLHKTLYTTPKFQIMLGGDLGGSFASSVAGSGLTVNLATSVTATAVYQLNDHWGVMVPVRGLYSAAIGGFNFIPEVGIVWKP